MPDKWYDVDLGLSEVPVNIMPLIDDTDFKSIEADVNYNATGLILIWHFTTTAGAYSQTAVTPTDTGGAHDWIEQGNGYFTIEIPATGGTINNDTEGFGHFSGVATGILPWKSPEYGFRKASMNNIMIDNGTLQDNMQAMFDGNGYAGGTTPIQVELKADAVNEITAAIWAKVVDGTITFATMSKILLAFTSGKVVITANSFAFYDQSNVLLFTLPITTSGRIPVIA